MSPTADLAYDSGQHSNTIPSVTESESIIAQDAEKALKVLEDCNALDLAEAFGLSNYLKGENRVRRTA